MEVDLYESEANLIFLGQSGLRSETLSEVPKKGKEVLELALLPLEHLNQDKYYLKDPMNNHSCSTAAGDGNGFDTSQDKMELLLKVTVDLRT